MPPEPKKWEHMSGAEKLEYLWQIVRGIQAKHRQRVREILDRQHAKRKTHGQVLSGNEANEDFTHAPTRCRDCGRPALPYSDKCYTCESD